MPIHNYDLLLNEILNNFFKAYLFPNIPTKQHLLNSECLKKLILKKLLQIICRNRLQKLISRPTSEDFHVVKDFTRARFFEYFYFKII